MFNEDEVKAVREKDFLAFCMKRGISPTDELRAAHRAGASCAAEFIRMNIGPQLALAQRSRSIPRQGREEASALNLWGLLR